MPHPAEESLVSVARFYSLALDSAYATGGPAGVDETALLQHIHAGLDRVISALGSGVVRPVTKIGADLEKYAYQIAALDAVPVLRGVIGTDLEILRDNASRAEAALQDLTHRPGGPDRKPYYEDSTPALRERHPLGGTRAPGQLENVLGGGCAPWWKY